MKKRLLAVVMSLVLAMGLVACGSKASSVSDDVSLEDLQAQINELKAENEELKAQLGEKEEQAEVVEETWTDDTIIAFTNAEMLELIRETTGITERDITAGDVKGITKIPYGLTDGWKGSLEPLKYFKGLVELRLCQNNEVTNLDAINGLTNLKTLEIYLCDNIVDINGISYLSNLQTLNLVACDNVKDIRALENLINLQKLGIDDCGNISEEDISEIKSKLGIQ